MRSVTPTLILLAALAFLLAGCSNPHAEVQAALAPVCSGQGVLEAAPYTGGGIHPVALLSSDGTRHSWSDNVADEWVPETVQEAQLVACVDEEQERSIEVCLYNGPSITRYRYTVSIRLVEARTGAQVTSTTLQGSIPRECRQTEDYDLTRLAGDHVPFSAAEEWMRVHVE